MIDPVAIDFFGEEHPVQLKDNPLLKTTANNILNLTKRLPNLLDGDTMGEIHRKITLAVWHESGCRSIMDDATWNAFVNWVKSKRFVDEDTITRATRFLASKDLIRLPAKAVQDAERQRQRIARSVE